MHPLVVHCKHAPFDVYIGRNGNELGWGNPYSHLPESAMGHALVSDSAPDEFVCATRSEAIEKYERWLLAQPDLVAHAREHLRGKVLGCWCAPKACHGHVLARIVNEWGRPDTTGVVCLDIETDALNNPRTERLGIQPLVCMSYSFDGKHSSLVDADAAVDLWLDWINEDDIRLLMHAGYTDLAALAQAAYRKYEGRDCDPGEGWAYELVFRAYEAGRIIDTEINQRLTQIAFGPSKGAADLGGIVSRTWEINVDGKRIPKEAQALLRDGVPYRDWPPAIYEATPWRVLYGTLKDKSISEWPEDAVKYALEDSIWPWRVHAHQHDIWQGQPMPDAQRQTLASWDLYLLSRPGWRADKPRAERIREQYKSAQLKCRKRLVRDGIIKQKVVHKGKPHERTDETLSEKAVKNLVYNTLGADTPMSKKAAAALEGRDPTTDELLDGAQRKAAVIRKCIIAQQAKVLDIVEAIEQAAKIDRGDEDAIDFDAWLNASGSPTFNAYACHTKAGTYIKNFLDRLATDHRVRTTYMTIVDTGRVSSRAINVQQLPRDSGTPSDLAIRGCIMPDPGWVLLVADYSQLELCALAHILSVMVRQRTGDSTYQSSLAQAINSGKDCHVLMAATLLSASYEEVAAIRKRAEYKKKHGEPLTREEKDVLEHRQIAKAANFGFPGGQGPRTYIEYAAGYGLTLTFDQATRARSAYIDTWPEMPDYFDMVSTACNAGQGIAQIKQLYSGRLRGGCYFTRACNSFFQGLAADGAKEALHRLIRAAYRDEASPLYGTRPSGFVHDEFIVSARAEQAQKGLPELPRIMVEGMSAWIPDVRIEAPGEIKSERWSK